MNYWNWLRVVIEINDDLWRNKFSPSGQDGDDNDNWLPQSTIAIIFPRCYKLSHLDSQRDNTIEARSKNWMLKVWRLSKSNLDWQTVRTCSSLPWKSNSGVKMINFEDQSNWIPYHRAKEKIKRKQIIICILAPVILCAPSWYYCCEIQLQNSSSEWLFWLVGSFIPVVRPFVYAVCGWRKNIHISAAG